MPILSGVGSASTSEPAHFWAVPLPSAQDTVSYKPSHRRPGKGPGDSIPEFSGHLKLPGSADVLGAMPTCCVSWPGGSPWGLISFTTQCLPVPQDACLLPGVQTGPFSCALRKALGVSISSPGTPNLTETSLHSSAPLRSPRGQKESRSHQPVAGLCKLWAHSGTVLGLGGPAGFELSPHPHLIPFRVQTWEP